MKIFYILFSILILTSACEFQNESETLGIQSQNKPSYEPFKTYGNTTMKYNVYDSLNNNVFIGEETWNFIEISDINGIKYYRYLINRNYQGNTFSGEILIEISNSLLFRKLEPYFQEPIPFLNASKPYWNPQDFDSLFSFSYNGSNNNQFSINTRPYIGFTDVQYRSNVQPCFRAGRDSTAQDGTPKPYFSKIEDYYFSLDGFGPLYLTEMGILNLSSSDSLVYSLVKKRAQ